MGIFDTNSFIENDIMNKNELLENYIYDELSRLPDERRKEFLDSQESKVMMEAGLISKKTLIKLSKEDDLSRRIKMACLQIAKDSDDHLYSELVKVRIKEKELLDKITNKYTNKAVKTAKMGQKDFLKNKMPVGFMRK